jgi:hypothetical protein
LVAIADRNIGRFAARTRRVDLAGDVGGSRSAEARRTALSASVVRGPARRASRMRRVGGARSARRASRPATVRVLVDSVIGGGGGGGGGAGIVAGLDVQFWRGDLGGEWRVRT